MAVTTDWNTYTSSNYYSTSTVSPSSQVWYYYDNEGQMVQGSQPPQHTHEMPSHVHGNVGNWRPGPSMYQEKEQVTKYNGNLELKIKGKWYSIEDSIKRIEQLESVVEKMIFALPKWQRELVGLGDFETEVEVEEFEHFDPDLFKV